MLQSTITSPEKRWLAAAVALVLLIGSLPYLLGVVSHTPAQPFTGVLTAVDDTYSYLAKMRVGAGGTLLYENRYALQPHTRTPLYGVYLTAGRLGGGARGARVPLARLVVAYHVIRLILTVPWLVLLYLTTALFIDDLRGRRLAWGIAAFGGGLGSLLVLSGDGLLYGPPLDLFLGEAVGFLALLATPHMLLARSALLGGVLLLVPALEEGRWSLALGAGGCWLLATWALPFAPAVAAGIVAGWLLVRWVRSRQVPLRAAALGLLAGLPGSLLAGLTLLLIRSDPVYGAWNAQNLLPLPPAVNLLTAFGPRLALAVPGVVLLLRRPADFRSDLLLGWFAATPLLTLIPLPFQLRLIEGWFVPLGVLGGMTLQHILQSHWRWRKLASGIVLSVLLSSLLFTLVGASALSLFRFAPAFIDPDLSASMDWLRNNAPPDAVVLSAERTGVMLPAAAPVRVLLGHGFETPNFAEKEAAVRAFYQQEMTPAEARTFLTRYGIDYVFYGPDERSLGHDTTLHDALQLDVAHRQNAVIIYRTLEDR